MFNVGAAKSETGTLRIAFAAPNTDRQSGQFADLPHRIDERGELFGLRFDTAQHGEQLLFVMVVHLDLRDPGTTPGDVVDDRVGESAVVGAQRGDDDFHKVGSAGAF